MDDLTPLVESQGALANQKLAKMERQIQELTSLVAELHTLVYTRILEQESESSDATAVDRPSREG